VSPVPALASLGSVSDAGTDLSFGAPRPADAGPRRSSPERTRPFGRQFAQAPAALLQGGSTRTVTVPAEALQGGPVQGGPVQAGPVQAGPVQAGPVQAEVLGLQDHQVEAEPVGPGAAGRARARSEPKRTRADFVVCRLLCVPTEQKVGEDEVYSLFSGSILLSALRCLLTYVFLPILTPVLGIAAGVGPVIGIPLSIVALYFDVRGMRRFWLANHRWRWYISGIYLAVMVLVAMLLVFDVLQLLR